MEQYWEEELNELSRNINIIVEVDGSTRVMPCTLREEALPPKVEKLTESKPRAKNESLISAYCLDKQEWRSFKVANVTNVKVLNGKTNLDTGS